MNASNVPDNATNERFNEVLAMIHSAKQQAMQAVNTQLIELYWQVGAYISRKLERTEWGDSVVSQLAEHLAKTQPGLRGFTRRNLFRMRQFYDAYRSDEKVSALLTQLPWTHNLLILTQSNIPEEREFYLRMAIQERWSTRCFTRSNLFRMRYLYEIYHAEEKVAPLVRQLSWSHNLIIFRQSKRRRSGSFTSVWQFRENGRSPNRASIQECAVRTKRDPNQQKNLQG